MFPRTILCILTLSMGGVLVPNVAPAAPSYPRKVLITSRVMTMDPSVRDTVASYDVIASSSEDPETVADIRAENDDLIWLFRWMPQMAKDWPSDDQDWWYADTTWSIRRLVQYYRLQNNEEWVMKDTSGEPIIFWGHKLMNWTRYCPKGTYGTSKGLTYAEWIVNVAMPQIMKDSPEWEPWGIGSSAYNGIFYEVFVDCFGSFYFDQLRYADPDGDGLPEGVDDTCMGTGASDSLSVLMREINEQYWADYQEVFGDDLPFTLNMNNPGMGPSWRERAWGIKLERWMNPAVEFQDWWDWFYGFRSPGGGAFWGPGYEYAEGHYRPEGPDEWTGWDLSFLELYYYPDWPQVKVDRMTRWALGTTLLGDGFFALTPDDPAVTWIDAFDWDLGEPMSDYVKEIRSGPDTLYVRTFSDALVIVNPQEYDVGDVAGEDAFIGFWQTLDDVEAEPTGDGSAVIRWRAPDGDINPVDEFEVRYAPFPISMMNWLSAVPAPGSPFAGPPDSVIEAELDGLDPDVTYFAAVRNILKGHFDPEISNVVSWGPDAMPPLPITDVSLLWADTVSARVSWTTPADQGPSGLASYEIRIAPSQDPLDEDSWPAAELIPDPPVPRAPGEPETLRVEGLAPEAAYALAVRSIDREGNVSDLSNPFVFETPGPDLPDVIPPDPLADLQIVATGETWMQLRWTMTGDDGATGVADSLAAVWRVGSGLIETQEDWDGATPGEGVPAPEEPGTVMEWTLDGLSPETSHAVALRVWDEAGNTSAIASVVGSTGAQAPPLAPSGVSLEWLGIDRIRISWDPVEDPGLDGYFVYRQREGEEFRRLHGAPIMATSYEVRQVETESRDRFAVTTVVRGVEGPLSDAVPLFGDRLAISGPFPQPVREGGARFVLMLPPHEDGAIPIRAVVYSATGRVVREVLDESAPAGRPLELVWDGIATSGRRVAAGLYLLKVAAGGEERTAKVFVVQ